MQLNKFYQKAIVFVVLLMIAFTVFLPLFSVVNLSLKTKKEMYREPTAVVQDPTFENYGKALTKTKMASLFGNSIVVLVLGTGGCIILGALVAFPLSRRYVRGSKPIYLLILASMSLPPALIPMYRMMNLLHLTNSLLGVSLYQMATRMPMAVFILTGFVSTIPVEIDEAATMDGCGYFRYIRSILFPLLRPAFSTVAILIGLNIWNDFFSAFLFLSDTAKRTVSSGLYLLRGEFSTAYNVFSAGLVLTLLPIIIFYIFFQKRITEGLVSGSVKG